MNIIGINLGQTTTDIPLMDGSSALLQNGDITCAIGEERISRKKYDGNFSQSLKYCLKKTDLSIDDIDIFAFSICCDVFPNKEYIKYLLNQKSFKIPDEKLFVVLSHHLSHAYSCFIPSSFQEALIVVADNEGNIIGERKDMNYWGNPMEKLSCYIGNENGIKLIERDFDGIGDLGIGNTYGYFTRWLGGKSYQDAGKIMGLAPYGNLDTFDGKDLFSIDKTGKITSYLEPINTEIGLAVRRFFQKNFDLDVGIGFKNLKKPNDLQKDISYYIQNQTEKILIRKIKHLVEKTGIKKLCFSGGVALNCVANYKLLEETGLEDIYIFPAAGDQGQSIGNAYIAYHKRTGKMPIKDNKKIFNPYLGVKYSDEEISIALNHYKENIVYTKQEFNDVLEEISNQIIDGKIIGWYQGESEFGPRALGNRSIIVDPRKKEMKDIINERIKHREEFRPFAPAILNEYFHEYFECKKDGNPYMLLACTCKELAIENIPATVHYDNTSRVQTVIEDLNYRFYSIIKKFYEKTGVPVLLNTSFNDIGEAIVETPEDAIKCFLNTNIDLLVLGDYIIKKK